MSLARYKAPELKSRVWLRGGEKDEVDANFPANERAAGIHRLRKSPTAYFRSSINNARRHNGSPGMFKTGTSM